LSEASGRHKDRRTANLRGDILPRQSFLSFCFQNLGFVHGDDFPAIPASSMPMNQELELWRGGPAFWR
jgi:hypothetical protein